MLESPEDISDDDISGDIIGEEDVYDRKEEAIVDEVLSDDESTSEVYEHENQLIIDTNIDSQDISNVYCRDFGNRVGLNATVNGHKVRFLYGQWCESEPNLKTDGNGHGM